ncbi:MAG: family 78 glycoside hydrolase catalytic domain [Clostridia bacterium]|nr:family 78 glycoside hydrolase catalytic domain [Clostridia bacterium]
MHQYTKEYRDFSAAMLISAPPSAREKFNRPKEPHFPSAKYLWVIGYTRFHAYRLFVPCKKVMRAEAAFLCDNLFELWLNGKPIATETMRLDLTDITDAVTDGENNLHLRAYQSSTDERYSAAITGGIRLYYEDGEIEEIVTDGAFRQVRLIDFGENDDPEGFETALPIPGKYTEERMQVMEMHPIACRRSFYFRKCFSLSEMPISARLYSSALGCYEPYANGQRVTDAFFMPFFQVYQKEYQEFDLLPFLSVGENTLGFITGNGWYNCMSWGTLYANVPAVLAIAELTYADGRVERICTDGSWQCAPSPLTENDLQYGERYDARLEIEDWCTPNPLGFGAVHAAENREYTSLLRQSYPFVKKMKEYRPTLLRILPNGAPLYDVGSCIAGRMRVKFRTLPAGKRIRLRYCERLSEDGVLPASGAYATVYYPKDCETGGRTPDFLRNIDVYTARGAAEEIYECRFAYTGFRYVWIEGLDSMDQLVEIVPFELRTALTDCGEIVTPSATLNRIFNAAKRSWLNNICNGPTDCPTREKNFWNGDSQIFSHAACWLTDNADFLSRWTDNGIKMHDGPYAWEDETYEIPLTLYRFYGDKEILRSRFTEMLKLIEKRDEYEGMLLPENPDTHQYCDWLSPKGVMPSKLFFGGCWQYHMIDSVARVAEIIGEEEIAKSLRDRAEATREAFNRLHLVDGGADYDARCQCGIVLPLAFGIAPEKHRQRLADTLAEYVRREDDHLTTGFIGTRFLPEMLCDYGYTDVTYRLLEQTSFPSWLHMLGENGTTISESWLGERDSDKMLSMSHFSLGSIVGWFFEYLGGIRVKDSAPGFSHVVLKPHPIKEIGSLAVKYQSIRGEIDTEWHYDGDTPVFTYHLPEGMTAEVIWNFE